MFPFTIFAMSKYKALAWALFCIGLMILLVSIGWGFMGACLPLGWAVIFSSIAAYKFIRDHGIVSNARIEEVHRPMLPAPPPMSSPGSSRLFLPPPLDRR